MPETSQKPGLFVGVDFGGTKILAGVFDAQLNCLARAKVSTKAERGVEQVIGRIARAIIEAVDECDLDLKKIRSIGLGAPGAVDGESGRVIFAPNLKWRDVPLKQELEKQLGVPVFLENDGNICTLGVYEKELSAQPKNVLGVFIGTGIGGGLVINGRLFHGFNRTAGEIGHMVLQVDGPRCGCGNRGCWEALSSRTAIFKRIEAGLKEGQETILTELLGPELKDLRSGALRKAIKKGDKFVAKVVSDAARYSGIAIANLINIFNPETIILGGGVIDALEAEMMPTIKDTAKEYAMEGTAEGIQIFATKVGDDAGILGGAVLARRQARP